MGSLDGLKVLDFSTLLPGPYATLMLAGYGSGRIKGKFGKQAGYSFGLSAIYR